MRKTILIYIYVGILILILGLFTSCKRQEAIIVTQIKAWDTTWEITIESLDKTYKCINTVYTQDLNMGDTIYILKAGYISDTIQ